MRPRVSRNLEPALFTTKWYINIGSKDLKINSCDEPLQVPHLVGRLFQVSSLYPLDLMKKSEDGMECHYCNQILLLILSLK